MSKNMVVTQPRPYIMTTVSNQWTSGICDCFQDLPQCCSGFWCFPCLACATTAYFGECFCLPLMDMITLCPVVSMSMRVAMRYHYKIQGDMGSDCVYSYFFNVCSWCQMAREIKRRR
uniref:Plac8 onzin related protein 6 n=1 Tax=Seriola dumerili TaxID=41447 RepID=A0A3B4VBP2_SERDU